MSKLPKIRIKLMSWDHKLLDKSVNKIIDMALGTGAKVIGPVYLPVKRRVFCVTRSPHVDKRSGEHRTCLFTNKKKSFLCYTFSSR